MVRSSLNIKEEATIRVASCKTNSDFAQYVGIFLCPSSACFDNKTCFKI